MSSPLYFGLFWLLGVPLLAEPSQVLLDGLESVGCAAAQISFRTGGSKTTSPAPSTHYGVLPRAT
ncbi:MAG: hypothetical protein H0T76_15735 [Nannocystis sp.]|nr:hypothetical protein [Nannocystis sp.]MBA3547934.1 hypothetical protein [Nannocystis sp.]